MLDLDTLNPKQKEAVLCTANKIMVMAGAGAGKTKVLTSRVAYLIENGTLPERILALTFTNKASKEMKERIEKMTGIPSKQINATTFHSFCVKILRKYIEKNFVSPYSKDFKILDEDDVRKILIKEMTARNIDEKYFKDILADRNASLIKKRFTKYSDVITAFNANLQQNNMLTFDELLVKAFYILQYDTKAIEDYQNAFDYILVDEYQDTDDIQYEMLKILCKQHKNLFVVGDDFQAIYSFRGASVENINRFFQDFPDYKLIKLEQNYRSTPEIINLANEVIKFNTNQIEKTLYTQNDNGDVALYNCFDNYVTEAEFIAKEIDKLVKYENRKYSDCSILYRVNTLSRTLEQELLRRNIPYIIYNGTGFYNREEVKDMLSFLYLIANPYDNMAFERIINKPASRIGERTIEQLRMIAIRYESSKRYSLLNACKYYEGHAELEVKTFCERINKIKELYLHSNYSLKDIIYYILYEMRYSSHLESLKSSTTNDRKGNIEELISLLSEYEELNETENIPHTLEYILELLQNIKLYTDKDTSDNGEKINAVNLMSIHASKGLEFPVVFLPALEDEIFPSARALSLEDIEEERRLFYVGITRAKEKLYLSSSQERFIYGNRSRQRQSEFIHDVEGSKNIQFNYR